MSVLVLVRLVICLFLVMMVLVIYDGEFLGVSVMRGALGLLGMVC